MIKLPKLLLLSALYMVPIIVICRYFEADQGTVFLVSLVTGCILGLVYTVPEENNY